ncbi:unnamed protein product [Rangifer tarandus platyrhynchus]|uniref:Uncharacterized protein n=1 Tax=Rangifer tarandus platyrhynchus TaxID=3082113 RepID=A0ABN8YCU9_RANTA|nr:unnamed protein product [Rangifer tarandus platyrhynchus]
MVLSAVPTLGLWLELFLQQLKPWWRPRKKHRYGKGRIGITFRICAPTGADENCNSSFGDFIKPVHKSTSKTEFLTKVTIVDALMPTCPETHHQCKSRGKNHMLPGSFQILEKLGCLLQN